MTNPNKPTLNKLKTSSLDRRLSLAKTSLNIGRRWATSNLGGIFEDEKTKQARKQAFMQSQSQYLVEEIGKLKGSVVKIGQMMALYGEHLLPPEVTKALHGLNDSTATLSWHAIAPVIRQQLGSRMDDLQINTTPIGTASLAQVHRATIKATGEQVVLKVQYPGVASAIDSDLKLFTNLLKVSNAVPQTRAFDEWIAEIRDLLYREVNYTLEAKTTKDFYTRLQNDPRYIVPKIIDDYSSNKIICMSYEAGVPLTSELLTQLPQERKNALGTSAIEIMLGEIFTWGEMQTDPNFGNYLVRIADDSTKETDKLILLDFGAIRQFDNKLLTIARSLLIAGFNHDKTQMVDAMKSSGYLFFAAMSDKVKQDMAEVFLLATEPFSDPDINTNIPTYCLDENKHYDWATSELHARIMSQTRSAATSLEFAIPPKEFMFISRKFIGAYTLLTILNAKTDAKSLVKPYFT